MNGVRPLGSSQDEVPQALGPGALGTQTMNQEATFRAVLGVGFLAVLIITLYHRLRSWASKERLDRRQEGLFVLATLRPVGLLLWLGVIAYVVNPA